MTSKVALVIIFNHKYDKNIPILERMYKGRFSNIFYLVPFYTGDRKDVIAVYENSYHFQGYIAQGFKHFYSEHFEHFFFIGDDLILNPAINENNYKEHLSLERDFSFMPEFIIPNEQVRWDRVKDAFEYDTKQPGVEIVRELPEEKLALETLRTLTKKQIEPLQFKYIYPNPGFSFKQKEFRKYLKWWYTKLKHGIKGTKFNLKYPLLGSYSDILVVSSDAIKQFCHYCGVFAATNLHVELAIPTALALSTANIVIEKDLKWQGKALWGEDLQELNKYNYSLDKLFNEFPPLYLYLHPIKLSKWK